MFNLLRQPYPTEEPVSQRVIKSIVIGAFVGLFLLVFQPFGLDDWQTSAKTLKILGFGGVTLIAMLAHYFVLPTLFPRYFSDERWTVGKEIVQTLTLVMVISVGNRLYLGWLIDEPLVLGSWLWSIGVTFLIGLFPITGIILLNYITQLKKYNRSANELPVHNPSPVPASIEKEAGNHPADTVLTLIADNEKDSLMVPAGSLLFIESSDNYCTVFYLKNGPIATDQVAKPLLRSSLSRLEKQIQQPPTVRKPFVRCHRSYVINLDRVERVTGNAQGYKLHLLGGQFQIPVARQYNETLIAELKAL